MEVDLLDVTVTGDQARQGRLCRAKLCLTIRKKPLVDSLKASYQNMSRNMIRSAIGKKPFDESLVGARDQALNFIRHVLGSFTEYPCIGKGWT